MDTYRNLNCLSLLKIFILFFILLTNSSCAHAGKNNLNSFNPEVNEKNLYQTVNYLTNIYPHRNFHNIKSLNEAASYIKNKYKEYGFNPTEQTYKVNGNEYKNIIATYGPLNAPRIIIGSHYDVCGDQAGADDNASAVAGLLETARLVFQCKPSSKYRIDFVAYSLEEPPNFGTTNMGSYVHAKSLYDSDAQVIGMICLEMIGYFSDQPKSQNYPISLLKLFYPNKGNFIGVVSSYGNSWLMKYVKNGLKKTSIGVRTLKAPSFLTGIDFSDHRNYIEFGYKAVMVTDTSFYRNPNYHEPSDTIDTLDFDKMGEVVKGICFALDDICMFGSNSIADSEYVQMRQPKNKSFTANNLKGKWIGEYAINKNHLKMVIKIGDQNNFLSGHFIMPNKKNIRIKDLVIQFTKQPNEFTASLVDQRGVMASLSAELNNNGNKIDGTWKDNQGYSGKFSLIRK